MSPVLKIENLWAGYSGKAVIRNIDLEISPGRLVALIGPNGAGKTTLLRCVAGLMKPMQGAIIHQADRIGYVPQQLQFDHALPLTVAEFLALKITRGLNWWLGTKGKPRETILAGLAELGAAHLCDRPLGRLSGGEFQRVMISYALLNQPQLLLLDEPTTGVDLRGGMSFDGLLHHLLEHRQIGILMVSHDLHLVEHISDEVFCINGTVCSHGPPQEVLRPENLARAYGHPQGLVRHAAGGAFFPINDIEQG